MKSEITQRSQTDATVKVTLGQSKLEPIVKKTLDQLRVQVKAAGFRPGKAPDHIVERELGAATVQNQVLEEAVKDSYAAAVQEHGLPVIASPEISISKFVPYTDLEYTARVAVMPTVPLPDFKTVKATHQAVKIADDEIDRVILDLQRRLANRQTVERPAKIGDEVNIDFEGYKDQQPVQGASSKGYDLILGSEAFVPGFETELVGLKPGDIKQFDVIFPGDYQTKDLAGAKVNFKVTLNTVTQIDLPVVNQEFVQKVSPLQTLAELRNDIKTRIAAEKTDTAQRQFENAVLDELITQNPIDVPAVLLEQQTNRLRGELENRLAGEGLDIDKYAKINNKSADQINAELRPEAEKRVKLAMILTEIAKSENLTVTADEIEAELTRLKSLYPDAQMQAELKQSSTKEELYNHLLATKTVERILEKVKKT